MRKQIGALAAPVPLLLLSVGVAHADGNDDAFIQQAHNVGVTGPAADLINNARQVCKGLDSGSSPDDLADAFVSQLGFSSGNAAKFVAVSVTHYCPQYGNLPFKRPH